MEGLGGVLSEAMVEVMAVMQEEKRPMASKIT